MANTEQVREMIDKTVKDIEAKVTLMSASGVSDSDLAWRLSIGWVLEQNYLQCMAQVEMIKKLIETQIKRSELN